MKFVCPACGKTLKVKDELAGKKGKCPGCGEKVTVPSVEQLPDENLILAKSSDVDEDDYRVADTPESQASPQPTHLSAETLKQVKGKAKISNRRPRCPLCDGRVKIGGTPTRWMAVVEVVFGFLFAPMIVGIPLIFIGGWHFWKADSVRPTWRCKSCDKVFPRRREWYQPI